MYTAGGSRGKKQKQKEGRKQDRKSIGTLAIGTAKSMRRCRLPADTAGPSIKARLIAGGLFQRASGERN